MAVFDKSNIRSFVNLLTESNPVPNINAREMFNVVRFSKGVRFCIPMSEICLLGKFKVVKVVIAAIFFKA